MGILTYFDCSHLLTKMRDRKYVKKSLAMLLNIQKHQNTQGLPSKTLELAAILENEGKLNKFWLLIFYTREISPFLVNSVCKITTVALLSGTPCIGMCFRCFTCTRPELVRRAVQHRVSCACATLYCVVTSDSAALINREEIIMLYTLWLAAAARFRSLLHLIRNPIRILGLRPCVENLGKLKVPSLCTFKMLCFPSA